MFSPTAEFGLDYKTTFLRRWSYLWSGEFYCRYLESFARIQDSMQTLSALRDFAKFVQEGIAQVRLLSQLPIKTPQVFFTFT
jgi:hypothetical protein